MAEAPVENITLFEGWFQESYYWPVPFQHTGVTPNRVSCYLELREDKLVITVHTYVAPDVPDELIERWKTGIDLAWNDIFRLVADSVPGQYYSIPVSADGTETPACLQPQEWRVPIEFQPFFYNNISDAPPIRQRSRDIEHVVDPNRNRGSTSVWWGIDRDDGLTVEHCAGHEFGHYIGNPDEYGMTLERFREVTGREPQDGDYGHPDHPPYEFYTAGDNIMGKMDRPSFKRHVQHFVDWLNENYGPDQCAIDLFRLEHIGDDPLGGEPASDQWEWYVIRSGDWLSTIAPRYGMTWQQLYAYDPTGGEPNSSRNRIASGDPNQLEVGEQIRVPKPAGA